MSLEALNNLSYGMYVITTKQNQKTIGCFINTAIQITSKNPIIAVSLNKENYTNQILKETRKCAISILTEKASQNLISKFGFFSSKEINKFEDINFQYVDEMPVVLEDVCTYIIGEVIRVIDVETHDIFLIRVLRAENVLDDVPMTYRYYHEKLKGKAPKKAPTYQEEKIGDKGNKYQCSICGYIYDDDKEKIKFEDLPDDWTCPMCGVGKDKFVKL